MRVGIVGAGAAGMACAAILRDLRPDAHITVYEKARRPMAKLLLTGGGRCNITNTFRRIGTLAEVYPRGHRLMHRLMHRFDQRWVLRWFEERGVRFTTQPDECVFPQSQSAAEIAHTLIEATVGRGVELRLNERIDALPEGLDATVVTIGGGQDLSLIERLGIKTEPQVPSLFGLRIDAPALTRLQGIVAQDAEVWLEGTRHRARGPLLITDWGLSGPATLCLSSRGARTLAEHDYRMGIYVNWTQTDEADALELLAEQAQRTPDRLLRNTPLLGLQARLWTHICERTKVADATWKELSAKHLRTLARTLTADRYDTLSRNPHKAEFVTCGGVSLSEIDPNTMEARRHRGLYFAGEVLDIDALTGGFNLQAAWSTAAAAAHAIAVRGE